MRCRKTWKKIFLAKSETEVAQAQRNQIYSGCKGKTFIEIITERAKNVFQNIIQNNIKNLRKNHKPYRLEASSPWRTFPEHPSLWWLPEQTTSASTISSQKPAEDGHWKRDSITRTLRLIHARQPGRGTLTTLKSCFTLIAARWLPNTIHVQIVSLILESTNIACLVDTSSSCWTLKNLA